jgi:hypothetical protein
MHVTEMLITGFDGDEAIFAVNLAPADATMASTCTDENGETVIDDVRQQATEAFEAVWDILERLAKVPAGASS